MFLLTGLKSLNTYMTNEEKLNRLLSAIDNIEAQADGSIVIYWRSSVIHQVPGHTATFANGYQILKGKQIHFNPEMKYEIKPNSIEFDIEIYDKDIGTTHSCCK